VRILMFDNEFPPLGGGTGLVNFHLLVELAAYPDIVVDLVTSSRTRSSYETERFAERITIYKVPVDNRNIHHSTGRELLRYSWRGLLMGVKLLKRRPYDLSFAFAGVPAGVISHVLWVKAGLPYLVSLQGPDVPGFEARYNALYPVLKPMLRRIWGHAAVVTAISQEHRHLAHQTMPVLDIAIVYNGVDIGPWPPTDKRRRGPGVNIVCVGRLIERKGHHHLLRAFARLRAICEHPLRLTLAGTGDAEDALHRLAADLGVTDAVVFAGFVARHEMPAVYHQADIFVLPSQNEGMSIALLEAMAAGLPVVVTDTGGTAELVREGVNGHIIPWADVQALTNALATLVRDKHARERMGNESQRIANQFGWPAIVQEYVKLCTQIAAQSRPVPPRKGSRRQRLMPARR
jgi:phosphatidylinositol alpha-1,6-mannosyltransferase